MNETRNGRRLVTVAIPNHDQCERTLRYAADRMCSGINIIVLDRAQPIPDDWMQQLVNELQERISEVATQAKKQLGLAITAQITGNGRTS